MYSSRVSIIPHKDPCCLHLKTPDGIFRLSPWRADFSCQRWQGGQWAPWERDPGMLLFDADGDGMDHEQQQLLSAFLESVPREVAQSASRFRWMQFPALRLMRRTPHALQLAEDNPVLFWCLAKAVGWGEMAIADAGRLLAGRRREIVAALFGECGATERTFRKMRGQNFDFDEYCVLLVLAGHGLIASLRHASGIDLREMRAIAGVPELAGCAFFQKMLQEGGPEDRNIRDAKYCFINSLALASELEHPDPLAALRRCKSLEALHRHHARIVREYHGSGLAKRLAKTYGTRFPAPPVAGSEAIQPIMSLGDLEDEGRVMQHCVFHLAERIFAGLIYVYRVLAPERGTLSISLDPLGPRVDEFALSENKEPSPASWRLVLDWIEKSAHGFPPAGDTAGNSH